MHPAIASWKFEQSSPIGHKPLSLPEQLKNVEPHHRADSGIYTLVDDDNKNLSVSCGEAKLNQGFTSGRFDKQDKKDTTETATILFSHRVEQMMDYLEKAFIYQEDKAYRSGFYLNISLRRLEEFDFIEVAESEPSISLRSTRVKRTGKGWLKLVRKSATLFGDGFGTLYLRQTHVMGGAQCPPKTITCMIWTIRERDTMRYEYIIIPAK